MRHNLPPHGALALTDYVREHGTLLFASGCAVDEVITAHWNTCKHRVEAGSGEIIETDYRQPFIGEVTEYRVFVNCACGAISNAEVVVLRSQETEEDFLMRALGPANLYVRPRWYRVLVRTIAAITRTHPINPQDQGRTDDMDIVEDITIFRARHAQQQEQQQEPAEEK